MSKFCLTIVFVFIFRALQAQLYERDNKVGIGITPPLGKLDVAGLTYLRSAPRHSVESEQLRIGRSDLDIRYHSIFSSHHGRPESNFLKFLLHSGGEKPYTAQSTVMTLLGNGNVGIGTTTPDSKLTVNGNIRAKEVKVEATNWPDYVFEEGYQQLSIEELETYIRQHGHLPGLKSAGEYEREGVNIMELNQKLLEKIEELTLTTINQAKKLNQLEQLTSQIQAMKSEIENLKNLVDQK